MELLVPEENQIEVSQHTQASFVPGRQRRITGPTTKGWLTNFPVSVQSFKLAFSFGFPTLVAERSKHDFSSVLNRKRDPSTDWIVRPKYPIDGRMEWIQRGMTLQER